jgi:hypothetical protein
MTGYNCTVDGCGYGADEDKSLAAVRSHVNSRGDEAHEWADLKEAIEAQADDGDDEGNESADDTDADTAGAGGPDVDEEYRRQLGVGVETDEDDEPDDEDDETEVSVDAVDDVDGDDGDGGSAGVALVAASVALVLVVLLVRGDGGGDDQPAQQATESEGETDTDQFGGAFEGME